MDWIDYRTMLGLGFDDDQKAELFQNNLLNYVKWYVNYLDSQQPMHTTEYLAFCNTIGCPTDHPGAYISLSNNIVQRGYHYCVEAIEDTRGDIKLFVFSYIAFVNSMYKTSNKISNALIGMLRKSIKEAHILCDVIEDEDGFFVFPQGAVELDNKLVSEPLSWLHLYPHTRKMFSTTLRQYSEGSYAPDIADNLRKTLELFFQEYLGNEKNLENNKTLMFNTLKEKGASDLHTKLFSQLLSSYQLHNNVTAKHHVEKVDKQSLEFLLYLTGLLLRSVLMLDTGAKISTTPKNEAT